MHPPNVVQDILSRVDVRTLVRAKTVCKEWCRLISSPSFQLLHRSQSRRRPLFLCHSNKSSYDPQAPPSHRFSYLLTSVDSNAVAHSTYNIKVDDPIRLVLPTCWGLLCFVTDIYIYVCNPALCQLLRLPPAPRAIIGFGFAYMESTQEYRVVRLLRSTSGNSLDCSVATVGPQGVVSPWRAVDAGCPYWVGYFSYPVFLRDCIYWKITGPRKNNDFLVCFNVIEETFSVVSSPPEWKYNGNRWTQLGDVGGRLCLIEGLESRIVIWVLRDDENSIWERGGSISGRGMGEYRCLHNSELVFSSFINFLFFFDIKTKCFRRLKLPLPYAALVLGTYWESFFSLSPPVIAN